MGTFKSPEFSASPISEFSLSGNDLAEYDQMVREEAVDARVDSLPNAFFAVNLADMIDEDSGGVAGGKLREAKKNTNICGICKYRGWLAGIER